MTLIQGSLLFFAAMSAGMINSVAGGGTLLTFPSLIWIGYSHIIANATSTVALVPGAWSSMWGYRDELKHTPRRYFILLIPSLIGGIIGAVLLKFTPPQTFVVVVPYLVLFATVLFMVQGTIKKKVASNDDTKQFASNHWLLTTVIYQFLAAIYGGYFGAGMGIMTLAALGFMGMHNIHQMNGLKNIIGSGINLVASAYFIYIGIVSWPAVLIMTVGAIIGGYGAAGIARKLGDKFVRKSVIVIGFAMAISLFFKSGN